MVTMANIDAEQIVNQFTRDFTEQGWPTIWQSELTLRLQMRQAPNWEDLHPGSFEEIEFIRRSFGCGGQIHKFWLIIITNLTSEVVQSWLSITPAYIRSEFWSTLTQAIADRSLEPKQLTFLITIYNDKFKPNIVSLVQLLDQPTCQYLINRTANLELRDILQARLNSMSGPDPWLDGLMAAIPWNSRSFPTIYGDKLNIIESAANYLRVCTPHNLSTAPHQTIISFWQGAEMLFKAGLLADCVQLLSKITDPSDTYHRAIWSSDREYNTLQLNLHLRRLLPFYALLMAPTEPHRRFLDLVRNNFPGFSMDPASLLYLDLYAVLMADSQQKRQYARYEINRLAKDIASHRPDDTLVNFLSAADGHDKLSDLEKEINARLDTVPHESLTIMEIILWYCRDRGVSSTRQNALKLGQLFKSFYAWIPAPQFASQRINASDITDLSGIWGEQAPGKDTSGSENMDRQRIELLNKFLGVF